MGSKFGFTTKCCSTKLLLKKTEIGNCPNCNQLIKKIDIVTSNEYFFKNNLTSQLNYLLNNYDLMPECIHPTKFKSFYDSEFYRKIKLTKGENSTIILLDSNTDGVEISSETDIWPLFFNILNLKSPIGIKIFLNSCFKSKKKPDLDFFLNDVIKELNQLFNEGIFIKRYNKRVFVVCCTILAGECGIIFNLSFKFRILIVYNLGSK